MRRLECSILVPLTEDEKVGNGRAHPVTRWLHLQDRLEETFRGWTIAPGRYHGMWLDEQGQPCTDRSRKYIVDVDEAQTLSLLEMAVAIGLRFSHRSVRVVVAGEVHYVRSGL